MIKKFYSDLKKELPLIFGLEGRVFDNDSGKLDSIPGRLIPPCLTLSNIRYVSRVKWSNPRKGVVPIPTPRCSSY